MGSRGYQRQVRKIRAQNRVLVRAYVRDSCAAVVESILEEKPLDPRFLGLDDLYEPPKLPYPFDRPPSPTGTIGGLARVHRDLQRAGFDVVPNGPYSDSNYRIAMKRPKSADALTAIQAWEQELNRRFFRSDG